MPDNFPRSSDLCLDGQITRNNIFTVTGGGFADVYEGILRGSKVAIKVLRLFQSNGEKLQYDKLHKRILREYRAWSCLAHPNILPCLGYSYDFSPGLHVFPSLISPWMEHGTVMSYLDYHPDTDRSKLLVGIADGLYYLHNHKPVVIHGDLRAGNILVSDQGVPCLTDFGLSLVLEEIKGTTTSNVGAGSTRWMSPELFKGDSKVTVYSDVWAFGMTILEILSGDRPYSTFKKDQIALLQIINAKLPSRPRGPKVHEVLDDHTWDVCQRCWSLEPTARPSMNEIISMITSENAFAMPSIIPSRCLDGRIYRHRIHPTAGGIFSDVYTGDLEGRKVAIKVLRQFEMSSKELRHERLLRGIWREYRIWSRLHHPNILTCLGYSYDFSPMLYMLPSLISPWIRNGAVTSYLKIYPDADRLNLLVGIADGLAYLHNRQPTIVHRDLRAGNVLVSDQGIPYLSGFGLSRALDEIDGVPDTSTEMAGPIRWMSPEQSMDDVQVSVHSDVWSYGMVLLEVFSGMLPYADVKNEVQVFLKINNGDVPSRPRAPEVHGTIDDDMWALCLRCWDAIPEARPSMEEVLATMRAQSVAALQKGSGREVHVELGHVLKHERVVHCCEFSANGRYLAVASRHTIEIYDTSTGSKSCAIHSDNLDRISSMCFTPDGIFLASGVRDGRIIIWNIKKQDVCKIFHQHHSWISTLEFSCDGQLLASVGGLDRTVRIWRMGTHEGMLVPISVTDTASKWSKMVSFSPEGYFVGIADKGNVYIWDAQRHVLLERLTMNRGIDSWSMRRVTSIAFKPGGKGVVCGCHNGAMEVWDLAPFLRHPDRDEPLVITDSSAPLEAIEGWGEKGSKCITEILHQGEDLLRVAMSRDGRLVISSSEDGCVRFWDSATAKFLTELQSMPGLVAVSVSPSLKGGMVATVGEHSVRLWNYTIGSEGRLKLTK